MAKDLAVISVYDKTNVVGLCAKLAKAGLQLVSTGGTSKALKDAGLEVTDVSDITKYKEMLGGRVKTLHPAIHAGILSTSKQQDLDEMAKNNMQFVRVVVCNLYPFKQMCKDSSMTDDQLVEYIDIGGVTLLRAAAKNHDRVTICCDIADYDRVGSEFEANKDTSAEFRRELCVKAFEYTYQYDSCIAAAFRSRYLSSAAGDNQHHIQLRYGLNPQQKNASLYSLLDKLPLKVLNGAPGYINILDALNGFKMVKEIREALGHPAAASFKHVSPAGAAIGVELSEVEAQTCMVHDFDPKTLTPVAIAYAKARGSDRMSSFGDFIAISDTVDVATAKIISREVSDGIIAPGYDQAALEILSSKKGGKYLVLLMDYAYEDKSGQDLRCVDGLMLAQDVDSTPINEQLLCNDNIVTSNKTLSNKAKQDMLLATIGAKYAQSNSVCFALDGQIIGLGAGQQSRIHCTRLAGDKADNWFLRRHPRVLGMQFAAGLSRADKANLIDLFVTNQIDQQTLNSKLKEPVALLNSAERAEWLAKLDQVAVSSDAFFPFYDNIERAAKSGAKYIASPGGSVNDDDIIKSCESKNIVLIHTKLRLFRH